MDVDNYWMRATPATDCSANNNADGIRAIVRYQGADTTVEPTSTPYTPGTDCVDETQLVPHVVRNVGTFSYGDEMDVSIVFDGYIKFTLNGTSLFLDWNNPTLLLVEDHDPSYPTAYNVVSLNGTAETVGILTSDLTNFSGNTLSFNRLVPLLSIILYPHCWSELIYVDPSARS